jgi:hypothetical protein
VPHVLEVERRIPVARHERTDIGEGFIWATAALVLGVLILCACLVLWLYPESRLDRSLHLPLPRYPAPRLQVNPASDMQHFHSEEMLRLNSSGWVDQAHGVLHIPISDAMREIAQEGIPEWPTAPQAAR